MFNQKMVWFMLIDGVLLPLFDTVIQIAASFNKFSVLVDAVAIAGLTDDLEDLDHLQYLHQQILHLYN